MVLSLVVAVTLCAPHARSSGPPAADPSEAWVTTQEGLRFRLAPGMSYALREEDGVRAHVGQAAGTGAAVAVVAVLSDSDLPCEGGSVEGVGVRAFVTSGGLRACALVPPVDGSDPVLASVFVKSGEVLVVVKAVAPGDAARRLAEAVADTVRVDPKAGSTARLPRLDVPRAEPRLVGCFEQSKAIGNPLGTGFTRLSTLRCFEEDLTFSEQSFLASSLEYKDQYGDPDGGSMAQGASGERVGTWHYADGVLTLFYDDGTEVDWRVQFGDGSLLADGKLWHRQ